MTKQHLPSIEALSAEDDRVWIAELRLSEVRDQVAVARSVLDELDRLSPVSELHPSSESRHARKATALAAHEIARLGCKLVELASVLSGVQGDSGVAGPGADDGPTTPSGPRRHAQRDHRASL